MKNSKYYSKNRRVEILKRLLEKEHLSYQRLSEEYLVSRSSIANDILWIKYYLAREGCHLEFDNTGTFLKVDEIKMQQIFKRLILERIELRKSIDFLIDCELLNHVKQAFYKTLKDLDLEIPDNYNNYIIVSITIMLERDKKHFELEMSSELIEGISEYPFVVQFVKILEKHLKINFRSNQLGYITNLLYSGGIRLYINSETISDNFKKRITYFINQINQGLNCNLFNNKLFKHLTIHLYQLMLRLKANTMVINPLSHYIKEKYPMVYGVTWMALTDFFQGFSEKITEDEVGFVALYIQAAIENQKQGKEIILVCPNGIGTSSYIAAKLTRVLPSTANIKIIAQTHLHKQDWSNIGFIVTTVPIETIKAPVIKVSTILTKEDIKQIVNYYIDFITTDESTDYFELSPLIKNYLNQSIYFKNLNSKESVLNFLFSKLIFSNEILKTNFCDSVIQREQQQSTFLDNGFSIPHGNPDFVEQSQILILILDKPIQWNKETVDIVVLLAIAKKDMAHLEQMMAFLVKGMENKEWFINKLMEVNE